MANQPIDFESANFALEYSWEVHRQAFGPILEPAFVENKQVRILLINALNHISRRETKRGMELLKEIQPHCIYDEDKAAWTFFVGLCFEMAGARDQMLEWYEKACQYGHRFYLPYLKLAKAAHTAAKFEKAKAFYVTAIDCLREMPENDQDIDTAFGYSDLPAIRFVGGTEATENPSVSIPSTATIPNS